MLAKLIGVNMKWGRAGCIRRRGNRRMMQWASETQIWAISWKLPLPMIASQGRYGWKIWSNEHSLIKITITKMRHFGACGACLKMVDNKLIMLTREVKRNWGLTIAFSLAIMTRSFSISTTIQSYRAHGYRMKYFWHQQVHIPSIGVIRGYMNSLSHRWQSICKSMNNAT